MAVASTPSSSEDEEDNFTTASNLYINRGSRGPIWLAKSRAAAEGGSDDVSFQYARSLSTTGSYSTSERIFKRSNGPDAAETY